MTALEKMTAWLQTFPLWQEESLSVDYVDALPGNAGLYPEGLEQVSRREDVLGNVTVENRLHFVLYRVTAGQQDNRENSQWLLELQSWVQQQSAAGLAPSFGDVPHRERISAQKGKLKAASQTGTGKYAVNLTVEFTKQYEK